MTGQPPFEGDDIGKILRMAQVGDFGAPRQVDSALDSALEAVCTKAMATKREDRYATCRALADDVERWMAAEPVMAYPEPWTRTLFRWLTRHRTGVTGVAAAVLAGVVGLSAVLAVQTRANAQLSASLKRETTAKLDLAAANGELIRSKQAVQARYDLAVDAIETFHTGVSEDFLLKQDQFRELRDRLLRSAQDFYGKLSALLGKETDAASRRALLASNFELADLAGKVGSKQDALKAHRAVLAAREALAAEPGAGAAATVDVGRSLTEIAGLLAATGQTDEALAMYRRSDSLLAGPAGTDAAARAARAACRARLGYLLFRTGQPTEALAAYQQARADQGGTGRCPRRPGRGPSRPGGHGRPHRHPAGADGQAGGGGGRVPPGAGDPGEAGRRQPPRRRRVPRARFPGLPGGRRTAGLVGAGTGMGGHLRPHTDPRAGHKNRHRGG